MKILANRKRIVYNLVRCDIMSDEMEVAAKEAGFPWSDVQFKKPGDKVTVLFYNGNQERRLLFWLVFQDTPG